MTVLRTNSAKDLDMSDGATLDLKKWSIYILHKLYSYIIKVYYSSITAGALKWKRMGWGIMYIEFKLEEIGFEVFYRM
jgi:hypothetical protein